MRRSYKLRKKEIEQRLREFREKWEKGSEDDIFAEFCFCLLTPQSKAVNCWGAVCDIRERNMLRSGCETGIAGRLHRKVRFHNHKASYIISARKLFSENGRIKIKEKLQKIQNYHESPKGIPSEHKVSRNHEKYLSQRTLRASACPTQLLRRGVPPWLSVRQWLVENTRGMGYKEASHFLRNIGFGEGLAILDRHILKNLKALGVIREIPETLTARMYFEIEEKMRAFSDKARIPLEALDLLFWSKETGKIFK